MSTSERAFNQVKAILNKLDRSIDEAREKRTRVGGVGNGPLSSAPSPAPAPIRPAAAAPQPAPAPAPSVFGRAQPMPPRPVNAATPRYGT